MSDPILYEQAYNKYLDVCHQLIVHGGALQIQNYFFISFLLSGAIRGKRFLSYQSVDEKLSAIKNVKKIKIVLIN